MNPFKYAQMMKYLTRVKKQKPDLPDVFPASEAPIPKVKDSVATKDAINRFVKANPRQDMAGGGMLVQPGFGGKRQGYASDYSPEERKQQAERGERIYETYKGKRVLGLNKDQKKWYNKTHKNNPNSRFYKKDWNELGGKKSDLLDSYFNEQKREKPPKGYITTKEFSKKYGFPIYEKRQYGPVTKAESNFINNALMKKITAKDADRGRKNLFLQKFLKETLEPKQFTVLKDLGDGKKSAGKVNYVKDNAALAKKVRTYIDSPSIDPKTIENMNLVLGNNKIKSLFNKGDYKGLVKALGEVENLTNSERANVMLRVSQAMSGVNFRDFKHNIKANKVSAKKIFKGLETGRAGVPNEYNDAYKRLKHNTIKDAIGEDYFTKSYQGFIDDSRAALKKAGIDITNIDLNEITGLSSGYKNKTFSSTQFVNFMDRTFNQGAHASMIGEYGRYEAALQTALKNGTVDFKGKTFTPRQLINNWQQWRDGWYDRLDPQYKTKAVRDILPTFTLGKDPYASVISKKRLAELAGLDLNIREEGIRTGYAKTFPTIGSQAVLKEAVNVEKILASFSNNPKCIVTFGKPKAAAEGGRIGYVTGSASLTECAKDGARVFNDGKFKTADQVQDAAKLLRGGRAVVSGLMKYGIIPELAYVGLEAAGRTLLGEQPTNALLKSIDTLTFGATDFGSGIEAEKFGQFSDQKLAVDKFRNSQALVNSLQNKLKNLEDISNQGGEGYVGDLTSDIQMTQAQLQTAQKALQENTVSSDIVQFIDRKGQEIADTQMAKSNFAKQSLKDQMEGIPGIRDYTDTESTRIFPKQPSQMDLNLNMFPTLPTDVMQLKTSDAIDLAQALRAEGQNVSAKDILAYRDDLKQMPLSKQAEIYGDEQVYGTQGAEALQPLAGGGIAKMAGVSSGPPPESGPNSQGLQGLMKRVRNL